MCVQHAQKCSTRDVDTLLKVHARNICLSVMSSVRLKAPEALGLTRRTLQNKIHQRVSGDDVARSGLSNKAKKNSSSEENLTNRALKLNMKSQISPCFRCF